MRGDSAGQLVLSERGRVQHAKIWIVDTLVNHRGPDLDHPSSQRFAQDNIVRFAGSQSGVVPRKYASGTTAARLNLLEGVRNSELLMQSCKRGKCVVGSHADPAFADAQSRVARATCP